MLIIEAGPIVIYQEINSCAAAAAVSPYATDVPLLQPRVPAWASVFAAADADLARLGVTSICFGPSRSRDSHCAAYATRLQYQ